MAEPQFKFGQSDCRVLTTWLLPLLSCCAFTINNGWEKQSGLARVALLLCFSGITKQVSLIEYYFFSPQCFKFVMLKTQPIKTKDKFGISQDYLFHPVFPIRLHQLSWAKYQQYLVIPYKERSMHSWTETTTKRLHLHGYARRNDTTGWDFFCKPLWLRVNHGNLRKRYFPFSK